MYQTQKSATNFLFEIKKKLVQDKVTRGTYIYIYSAIRSHSYINHTFIQIQIFGIFKTYILEHLQSH